MAAGRPSPKKLARAIRAELKRSGSPEHAKGVQWFFKEDVKSHGWYTCDLRALARKTRRELLPEHGLEFLVQLADELFTGQVLEEKIFGVLLLAPLTRQLNAGHFDLLESWIARIGSWADHDALVHSLIAPMVAADRRRMKRVFTWAKSADRWHRRAACVALIQGGQQSEFFRDTVLLSSLLLTDKDEMVQKGLGWLLRVSAKADPESTIPYLMSIRERIPRLVLRTASETLRPAERKRILAKRVK
jgi:3-methyladenine DNA glycosylase AlkD